MMHFIMVTHRQKTLSKWRLISRNTSANFPTSNPCTTRTKPCGKASANSLKTRRRTIRRTWWSLRGSLKSHSSNSRRGKATVMRSLKAAKMLSLRYLNRSTSHRSRKWSTPIPPSSLKTTAALRNSKRRTNSTSSNSPLPKETPRLKSKTLRQGSKTMARLKACSRTKSMSLSRNWSTNLRHNTCNLEATRRTTSRGWTKLRGRPRRQTPREARWSLILRRKRPGGKWNMTTLSIRRENWKMLLLILKGKRIFFSRRMRG